MIQTSENVSNRYGISRERQDYAAYYSQMRACHATKAGWFKKEIVPITVADIDPTTGVRKTRSVTQDEGLRDTTTTKVLAKLRSVQRKGTTTAGNASQVSDGAAACLLMKRSRAKELGLPILGRFIHYTVAGVEPSVMGIGPAEAIPKVLRQAGITKKDIDLWEINEAFASQFVYCLDKLGIDLKDVNVKGGAIALGHPVGCTGARMTATLLHELRRRKQRYGVVSMCMGTGMGAAAIFEAEW
eukprot:TRINITY_DN2312_c0_g1_i1.p1 TRINITY_DN2312_c0_g1~~TRINITY_DN2312_c0_g1_i1.p1  ORF type:complete len:243 (-),score=41.40 TRINITY_DN2312_c0_g1_i1:694-1422(-)